MQPKLQPLSIEARLADVQVRYPKVDVPAEYRKACAKYGRAVEVGWFEACWLPRCRVARRRSRAAIASAVSMDVFKRAKDEAEPLGWASWFDARYPGIDRPAWVAAPIDMKMRHIREQVAQSKAISGQV